MLFIITGEEFAGFSTSTRHEIMANADTSALGATVPKTEISDLDESFSGIEMEDVADITPKQMREWMSNASDKTKKALRLFANKPIVTAQELMDAGVENVSHFQSRTTVRTRTVTGNKGAFLLGWDDWQIADKNQGRYAVTPITHHALRTYFKLV